MQTETRAGISRSIVGVYDSSEGAQRALEELHAAGLGPDEVSVMMRDAQVVESVEEQVAGSPVAGGAATGAALGGLLGGLAGWMLAIGAIAIPGVGLVIGAGALATMLAGIALGAATGGLVGGLLSLGVPEDEARQYEGHLREGRVLLTVHPSPDFEVTRATEILEANGAYDVRVYDAPPERMGVAGGQAVAEQSEVELVDVETMVQGEQPPVAHIPGEAVAPFDDTGSASMVSPSETEVAGTYVESPRMEEGIGQESAATIADAGSEATMGEPAVQEPAVNVEMVRTETSEVRTEEPPENVSETRGRYQPE